MPRPIEMDETVRDYLTQRIRTHCPSMEQSAQVISAALNIPEGTVRGWIAGRQLPSSVYMDKVLAMLGLYRKECHRCKSFAVSEDIDDIVLCNPCSRMHVIRDGKVVKK